MKSSTLVTLNLQIQLEISGRQLEGENVIQEPQAQKNHGGEALVFEMGYKRVSQYSQPSDHTSTLVTTPSVESSLVNR